MCVCLYLVCCLVGVGVGWVGCRLDNLLRGGVPLDLDRAVNIMWCTNLLMTGLLDKVVKTFS